MQIRSVAAHSPTQSSPLSQIPEPPPSILEAHAVLHTETYICGMTEAIKSADNFQQICICCCCCLYKWFQVNYKYKNQGPKIGFQRNHLQMWLDDTSLEHSKNHLSRKSRRNISFSRGSHAKHLLEYTLPHLLNIYAALRHKGCHKLEHLSLVPGCSYVWNCTDLATHVIIPSTLM